MGSTNFFADVPKRKSLVRDATSSKSESRPCICCNSRRCHRRGRSGINTRKQNLSLIPVKGNRCHFGVAPVIARQHFISYSDICPPFSQFPLLLSLRLLTVAIRAVLHQQRLSCSFIAARLKFSGPLAADPRRGSQSGTGALH